MRVRPSFKFKEFPLNRLSQTFSTINSKIKRLTNLIKIPLNCSHLVITSLGQVSQEIVVS